MIHILNGRGDNCSCSDCAVLYGDECWTTNVNNALDIFDQNVKKLIESKKHLSYYQLYKIIKPHLKTFKKDCQISVKDLDSYYKGFMPLMIIAGNGGEIERSLYRQWRYNVYLKIVLDLSRFLKEEKDREDD